MDQVNEVQAFSTGPAAAGQARAPANNQSKTLEALQLAQVLENVAEAQALDPSEEAQALGNPLQRFYQRSQTLQERIVRRAKETSSETSVEPTAVEAVSAVEESAMRAQRRNPELQDRALLLLFERCQSAETAEEILEIVQEFYNDPALADDALIFLSEATIDPTRRQLVEKARTILNQRYEKEIRSGKNIQEAVQKYAASGLEKPGSLRALYRDVVDTPREPAQLFEELARRFSYDELKQVIKFLIHCLNNELKDPVMRPERADFVHLMAECRVLSAILGVYYFFASRQKELFRQFTVYGSRINQELHFENLARLFCRFIDDRYPIPEKVLQVAERLLLGQDLVGQSLVFSQFGQAVDFTAPRLYRSIKEREDLRKAFQRAVEMVDEKLETQTRESLVRLRKLAMEQQKQLKKAQLAAVRAGRHKDKQSEEHEEENDGE